ncbi:MAG TPA: hypothetical protein VEY94_06205 [Patescibacteria group bacterium]|nr:hypothetical protein [Patescibacteria group bacterium]
MPLSAAEVEMPPALEAYAAAIDDLIESHGKQPIEPVFEDGMKAAPKVQAILPDLTEAQYQTVQRQMKGFIVVRGEHQTTVVRPSVDFFKDLARKQGTKADKEFFAIYQRTEPDGNGPFPAYIQQQTDEAGCTRFDGKLMVELYRGWLTFRTSYPDAYATEAQGEIDSLESELLSGICACGGAEKTTAGLQAFVDAFPDLPITPKIKARIARIRSGNPGFRFNCRA